VTPRNDDRTPSTTRATRSSRPMAGSRPPAVVPTPPRS